MDVVREYDCPRCWGTGSLGSSDSTDDRWWDCAACKGTGRLADRRYPARENTEIGATQ
jgi:DnaJ-class molecular chaperone